MNLLFQECINTSPNSAATEVSLNHGIIFSSSSLWQYSENSATSLIRKNLRIQNCCKQKGNFFSCRNLNLSKQNKWKNLKS